MKNKNKNKKETRISFSPTHEEGVGKAKRESKKTLLCLTEARRKLAFRADRYYLAAAEGLGLGERLRG